MPVPVLMGPSLGLPFPPALAEAIHGQGKAKTIKPKDLTLSWFFFSQFKSAIIY